ncbi:restriction endonuclease subunit S [Aeromonas salmonicida]
MELMPGYKRSDVGVIPDDWDVLPLGKLVRSVEYGSAAKSDVKGAVPVLRMGNLQGGKIDWSDLVYTDDIDEINKYTLQPGDVLFNRTNTIDLVGKTSIYEGGCPAIFAGYLIRINVVPDLLDSRFLNYILNTEFSRKYSAKVLSVAVGQANINGQKLKTYPIPLPPTKTEQEDIAQALNDADELLVVLDQMIAKKRDLKQAAMQQLLTGEKRLPGFSGEWEILPAREIGTFKGGSGFPLRAQGETDGEYPFFKVSDMNNEGNETFMTAANHYVSEWTRLQLGAAAFPADSIVFAKVGAAVFLERKRILGQASCIDNNMAAFILDKSRVDVGYIHALLLSKKLSALVATTALPALNAKQLGEMSLAVPPLPEQLAIATVLSEMDAELSTLEARRDKTHNIKQAMMQELLTGKTRLVEP